MWDQDGGFICDHHGNITKDWSWQTGRTPREKIVIQVQPPARTETFETLLQLLDNFLKNDAHFVCTINKLSHPATEEFLSAE